jgi:hypothetical protein
MTPADQAYVSKLLSHGVIQSPVLELGAGYGGDTGRGLVTAHGLEYYGTDLVARPGVDFVADFEYQDQMRVFDPVKPFGSVLVLNVLELRAFHTPRRGLTVTI